MFTWRILQDYSLEKIYLKVVFKSRILFGKPPHVSESTKISLMHENINYILIYVVGGPVEYVAELDSVLYD